jgi:apolipoprotein N-acyltransferase
VTDELVRLGAEALIVPTMDVADWGARQHQLHARVAPVRAREYGIPIFRLASSGVSQAVNRTGAVSATGPFPGEGAALATTLELRGPGRLPVDHWLAPSCVVVVVVTILVRFSARRKANGRGPGEEPAAPGRPPEGPTPVPGTNLPGRFVGCLRRGALVTTTGQSSC